MNNPLPSRSHILGVRLDALSRSDIFTRARRYLISTRPHQIVTLNSLMVLEAKKNPELVQVCADASMVVAESSGISLAATYSGVKNVERIAGIDLAFELCRIAEAESIPVYLLGGGHGVAQRAARTLSSNFGGLLISGMRDGFFAPTDEPTILKDIAQSQAGLVLVALGMPRQELWIHSRFAQLPPAVYMGVGGSFDVWSGQVRRAPKWVRRAGLEWLFRLKQEPFRWRRIARLPQFALQVAARKATRRQDQSR